MTNKIIQISLCMTWIVYLGFNLKVEHELIVGQVERQTDRLEVQK